jgi:hypothetical protein
MYSLDGKLLWQRAEPLDLRHQHVYPVAHWWHRGGR